MNVPPETQPENSKQKNYLAVLAVAVVVVVAIIEGYIYFQTSNIASSPSGKSAVQNGNGNQIQQIVESIPPATSSPAQINQLIKSIPKQTTLTAEEKSKILQSIPSSTPQ